MSSKTAAEQSLEYGLMSTLLTEPNHIEIRHNPNISKNDPRMPYGNLFMNGRKVSDRAYRVGGMGGTFKDGYCSLIVYEVDRTGTPDFGTHCLINELCQIKFISKDTISSFYHKGGRIVVQNNSYIDIEEAKIIATGYSSVQSDDYIFVQNDYDKNYPIGVIRICLADGTTKIYKKT